MLIYEVDIEVLNEREAEYLKFLSNHIPDILKISGFLKAHIYNRRASEENTGSGKGLLTVHYHLEDEAALQDYLNNKAPEMRKSATAQFGDTITISRRILRGIN